MNAALSSDSEAVLEKLPSITELLKSETAAVWLKLHPPALVTRCLRLATARLREQIRRGATGELAHPMTEAILASAAHLLDEATTPQVRGAINATGIILHTGLGRAVLAECVVDSMVDELKQATVLAVDRDTGERIERDELVEELLIELTGAEAGTVVNNNAAATMLVLTGLACGREVIVSRGQLVEIGGSFRLPEVMAQSGARMVEVGATNRTHLKDYRAALNPHTAAIMRVHPSNYRVIGFTSEVELRELAQLAHSRHCLLIDDLGAGALVDLGPFGLPAEPTVRQSIEAGADVVLFSGDKLIGAGQAGVIVGRKELIDGLRKHPLMRAVRVDKTCLMLLERTLQLFRTPERLRQNHPTYRMMAASKETLRPRAEALVEAIARSAPTVVTALQESVAYLGSGALPTQGIPSLTVSVSLPGQTASQLARSLRLNRACIFGRIEEDLVRLDVRTITDQQVPLIAEALGRIAAAYSRHAES